MKIKSQRGLEDLCNAVVERAADDYRHAYLGYDVERHKPELEMDQLEHWFHSEDYSKFTDVDPDYLLKKLKISTLEDGMSVMKDVLSPMGNKYKITLTVYKPKGQDDVNYRIPPILEKYFFTAIREAINDFKKKKDVLEGKDKT